LKDKFRAEGVEQKKSKRKGERERGKKQSQIEKEGERM
jgi:hypothetical protein